MCVSWHVRYTCVSVHGGVHEKEEDCRHKHQVEIFMSVDVSLCGWVSSVFTPSQHAFWWSPDGAASPLFLFVRPLMIQWRGFGEGPGFFTTHWWAVLKCFRDKSNHCSKKSGRHASDHQQNQLAGYVVRLYYQRCAHNLFPNPLLWSGARLLDGQIVADVGVWF